MATKSEPSTLRKAVQESIDQEVLRHPNSYDTSRKSMGRKVFARHWST
jgi:hypothetical protein